MPRQRLRKTYGKRARLLTATAFLIFQGRVREREEREQVRQSVGRATKWIWIIQKMRLLFAKCAVNWDATRGKARGGAMKTSDDDEGNSSCDSRRKIMFYLWVAQLPLLLILLSLLLFPSCFTILSLCCSSSMLSTIENWFKRQFTICNFLQVFDCWMRNLCSWYCRFLLT